MIDLDVRLESSLGELDYGYLYRLQGLAKKEECILSFPENNRDDYIKTRESVLELLQTEDALRYAFASLLSRLEREGHVYVEISFNPYLHTKGGLSVEEVTKIAVDILRISLDTYNIDANIILYSQRSTPLEITDKIATLAYRNRFNKVIGFGLEGDTDEVPLTRFTKIFNRMKKNNFPVVVELPKKLLTITELNRAIKFGARRIISCYGIDFTDKDIFTLNDRGIQIEYRFSHDLINGYMEKEEEFPLKSLWFRGFNGFLAGCSYSICGASLENEYKKLIAKNIFTPDMVRFALTKSLDALFVPVREKSKIAQHYAKQSIRYFDRLFK